ncbi:hypothetical protein C0992_000963, partial [Termitomyces sp. T32_za158]
MTWYYAAKSLTLAALDQLVYTVILAPDFNSEDFEGFSAARENRRLDDLPTNSSSQSGLPSWAAGDIWKKASVYIPLPLTRYKYRSEQEAPTLQIDFFHRDILEVFKSVAQSVTANKIHWRGFHQFWRPSEDKPEQRVYGE